LNLLLKVQTIFEHVDFSHEGKLLFSSPSLRKKTVLLISKVIQNTFNLKILKLGRSFPGLRDCFISKNNVESNIVLISRTFFLE